MGTISGLLPLQDTYDAMQQAQTRTSTVEAESSPEQSGFGTASALDVGGSGGGLGFRRLLGPVMNNLPTMIGKEQFRLVEEFRLGTRNIVFRKQFLDTRLLSSGLVGGSMLGKLFA